MKSIRFALPLILALVFSLAFAACAYRQDLIQQDPPYQTTGLSRVQGAPTHADSLQVGAARTEITPTESLPMGGYGVYFWSMDNTRLSQDAHDPLYATAIYFLKGDDALVMIQTDLVGLPGSDMDVIRDAVALRLGIKRERIIVSATHTHHSPDTIGLWGTVIPAQTGRSERYINYVKKQTVAAAVAAFEARKPAKLYYAIGEEKDLHWNERIQTDPQASLDSTITVLKAVGDDGKVVATLTNWGCHPTSVGMDNLHPTSDWVGYFYQNMAGHSEGVHMFVNGSIGAAIQPSVPWLQENMHTDQQSFAWAEQIGNRLGDKTYGLLQNAKPVDVDSIEIREGAIPVRLDNMVFRFAKVMGVFQMELPGYKGPYTTHVTAVKMGNLRIGTMPGEVSPQLGMQIRETLGGDVQLLVGLSQDYLGYIIDTKQYDDGRYAYEKLLCVSRELGEKMVATYREMNIAAM